MHIRYSLLAALFACLVLATSARSQHAQEDLDLLSGRHPDLLQDLRAERPGISLIYGAHPGHALWSTGEKMRPGTYAASAAQVWLLSEQLSQQWDVAEGVWIDESRVTISRDEVGFETELLIEDWEAETESWAPTLRVTTERDADGRAVEIFYEEWEAGANDGEGDWLPSLRNEFSYNAQGRRLMNTTEFWDEDAEVFEIIFRTTRTYDDSGEIVLERLFESALFGTLEPSILRNFTYNDDGRVVEELIQNYNTAAAEWENSGLEQNTYDNNGAVVEELVQAWDPAADGGAGGWVNEDRTLTRYTPDSANRTEIEETDQIWDSTAEGGGGAWINDERNVITYSSTEIVDTDQIWDPTADGDAGAWINEERSIDRFGAAGEYLETIDQVWDAAAGGAWVNEERGTVERDENDLVVVNLWETWDGTVWVNESRLLMTYEDFTRTAVEDEDPRGLFRLDANYPNPFRDKTTLRFTLSAPEHVTLEVFDLLGRRITTLVDAFTPTGTHQVTMEGAHLAGGLYVYRLRGEHTQASRTMLVVK